MHKVRSAEGKSIYSRIWLVLLGVAFVATVSTIFWPSDESGLEKTPVEGSTIIELDQVALSGAETKSKQEHFEENLTENPISERVAVDPAGVIPEQQGVYSTLVLRVLWEQSSEPAIGAKAAITATFPSGEGRGRIQNEELAWQTVVDDQPLIFSNFDAKSTKLRIRVRNGDWYREFNLTWPEKGDLEAEVIRVPPAGIATLYLSQSGRPLEGALVSLLTNDQSQSTYRNKFGRSDVNGKISFESVAIGNWHWLLEGYSFGTIHCDIFEVEKGVEHETRIEVDGGASLSVNAIDETQNLEATPYVVHVRSKDG